MGRVAGLAGVTVRTLHHYDEIGLVRPSARTAAGYRAYSAGDVERLRQVLACRRLGFGLREVADLVGDPSADAAQHLERLLRNGPRCWHSPGRGRTANPRRGVRLGSAVRGATRPGRCGDRT